MTLCALRDVDLESNRRTEHSGQQDTREALYEEVSVRLGSAHRWREVGPSLISAIDDLFVEHHPELIDPFVPDYLACLRSRGCSVSLTSNTAFVPGITIRRVLDILGLGDRFDFLLFSDEVGVGKPNPEFMCKVFGHRNCHACVTSEVLHLGDNEATDGEGARLAGYQFELFDPRQGFCWRRLQREIVNAT